MAKTHYLKCMWWAHLIGQTGPGGPRDHDDGVELLRRLMKPHAVQLVMEYLFSPNLNLVVDRLVQLKMAGVLHFRRDLKTCTVRGCSQCLESEATVC